MLQESDGRAGRLLGLARTRAAYVLLISFAALAGFWVAASAGIAAGAARRNPGSGGSGLSQPTSRISAATSTTPTSTTPTPTTTTSTPPATTTTTGPSTVPYPAPPVIGVGTPAAAFRTRGMWIWVLADSDGGSVSSVIADAERYGYKTLIIKSSDGAGMWPQFTSKLVQTLHGAGLHVCAWQYVYGAHPILEAQAGAQAVSDGADCLVIDAEAEYQGRYVQAQTYITKLRSLIGASFPVALAGFPYVDYHASFPYSVFLGPGGAQYNMPQMYWYDIGTTVQAVYRHTYEFNELYERPISPLGQLFQAPPASQIYQFRSLSRYYGGTAGGGISWWDWQEAEPTQFAATAKPVGGIRGFVADTAVAELAEGDAGDVVVWAQEHLISAGDRVTVDGEFGPQTQAAVESFQAVSGLPVTGVLDPVTWSALLRYQPAAVTWVLHNSQLSAQVARGGREVLQVPKSASLRERADELAGAGGAGLPDSAQRGPAGPRTG